jgi:MFS family permease
MLDRLRRLHPFQTPDAQRLAILFAVVYFAQGMWSLPNQSLTITLKERGLSAGQVATFFSFGIIPWLIKPVYGLLSDCVPLFGRRRKSYLLLTSALAAGAGLAMGLAAPHSYWWLVGLITVMGLGLAFTDVLVDALMVENGKPRGSRVPSRPCSGPPFTRPPSSSACWAAISPSDGASTPRSWWPPSSR